MISRLWSVVRSQVVHIYSFSFQKKSVLVSSVTKRVRSVPFLAMAVVKFSQSKNSFLSSVAMLVTLSTFRTLIRNKRSAMQLKKMATKQK